MKDTPKTDSIVTGNCTPSPEEYEELAAFARQLERDNKKLITEVEASRRESARLHGSIITT